MADHSKFTAMALRLIAKNGRLVDPQKVSLVPVDPVSPWKGTTQSPVSIAGPVMAAMLPFRGFEFGSYFEQTNLFKECEQIALIAGGQGEFEDAQLVLDEGRTYAVQWVQRLRPAQETILYAIGINR